MRINCGCGATPTAGWTNFDNSLTLLLARHPIVCRLAKMFGLLDQGQLSYFEFSKANSIFHANVVRRIPVPDSSVDVLYTSHMLEHLDLYEAGLFLTEAKRVLKSGGVLRVVVPDLRMLVNGYLAQGDADAFVAATLLAVPKPRGIFQRIKVAIIGGRHHQWMYDANSLCKLISENGYKEARALGAGETRITDCDALNLYERSDDSVYVEAVRA